MSTTVHFRLAQLSRPPALGPRERAIDPAVERTLEAWIRAALEIPSSARIALSEWVSLDSRATPHIVSVCVHTGRAQRYFTIGKASERIADVDVRAAVA